MVNDYRLKNATEGGSPSTELKKTTKNQCNPNAF
jgi:hypothetical protein